MTRQHFEMIAAALMATRGFAGHAETVTGKAAHAALDRAAENLAVKLGAGNPRFKTALFLKACGCA